MRGCPTGAAQYNKRPPGRPARAVGPCALERTKPRPLNARHPKCPNSGLASPTQHLADAARHRRTEILQRIKIERQRPVPDEQPGRNSAEEAQKKSATRGVALNFPPKEEVLEECAPA
jgi:hypothetical protein